MPTKQTLPLRSIREAATVIISSDVYPLLGVTALGMARHLFNTLPEALEIFHAHHVTLLTRLKRFAFARDLVPLLVKRIVARVIALRVGRKRPAFHFRDRAHHPRRQNHCVRRR